MDLGGNGHCQPPGILSVGLQALKLQACKPSSLTKHLGYCKIIKKEKMAFKTKVVLVVLLVALLIGVPPGLGKQSPKESREDLYSIWIKLSMMGHNQSEIEGILTGISQQQLQHLKNRLRRDVLNTLTHLNLSNEIELSRTEQDMVMIRDKIRTEIRFAGLENDLLLQRMIRHKFGIALKNI